MPGDFPGRKIVKNIPPVEIQKKYSGREKAPIGSKYKKNKDFNIIKSDDKPMQQISYEQLPPSSQKFVPRPPQKTYFTRDEAIQYVQFKQEQLTKQKQNIKDTSLYKIDDSGRYYYGEYIKGEYLDTSIEGYKTAEKDIGNLPEDYIVKKTPTGFEYTPIKQNDVFRISKKGRAVKEAIKQTRGNLAGEMFSFTTGFVSSLISFARPTIKYLNWTGPQLYGYGRGMITPYQAGRASQGLFSVHFPTPIDPVLEPFGLAPSGSTEELVRWGPSFLAGGITFEIAQGYAISKFTSPASKFIKAGVTNSVRNVGLKIYREFPKGWSRAFPKLQPIGNYIYGKVPSHIPITRYMTDITSKSFGAGSRLIITSSETTPVMTATGKIRYVLSSLKPKFVSVKYTIPQFRSRVFNLFKTGFKRFTGLERAIGKSSVVGGSFETYGFGGSEQQQSGVLMRLNQRVKPVWGKTYISEEEYFSIMKPSYGRWSTGGRYFMDESGRVTRLTPSGEYIGETISEMSLGRTRMVTTKFSDRFRVFLSDTSSGYIGNEVKRIPKRVMEKTSLISRIKTRFGSEFGGMPSFPKMKFPKPSYPRPPWPSRSGWGGISLNELEQMESGISSGVNSFWKGIGPVGPSFPSTAGQNIFSGIGRFSSIGIGVGSVVSPKVIQSNVSKPSSLIRSEINQKGLEGIKMDVGMRNIQSNIQSNNTDSRSDVKVVQLQGQMQKQAMDFVRPIDQVYSVPSVKTPYIPFVPKDDVGKSVKKLFGGWDDMWGRGYRIRSWKVPSLEDLFKIK